MIYDCVIIGGGVIGLSILRSALLAGHASTLLLERDPDLCDGASGRNSGVLCTGADAAPGSLERALIRDSISCAREFCGGMGVPTRECGSLVCLWPWDVDDDDEMERNGRDEKKFDDDAAHDVDLDADENDDISSRARLKRVLRESHIAGDKDAAFLSSSQASELEPSLSSSCRGAVHIPGETVVDPWLFPLALAVHARELAARMNSREKKKFGSEEDVICTGREVVMEKSSFDSDTGLWTIVTRKTTNEIADEDDETMTITARCVINAAGINSDLVQLSASSANNGERHHASNSNNALPPPAYEARPRRGQYAIFSAPKQTIINPIMEEECNNNDNTANNNNDSSSSWPTVPNTIPTRPIQPVPSQFTKGIFVYSTLYDQIVVGPTARDQSSRTDDTIDEHVAEELAAHASRILGPQFAASEKVGEYVGIRPGTSERDYQIRLHHRANFITVGGVRSTGLTASLGIGRHVVQCLLSTIVPPPVAEEELFESNAKNLPMTPLPSVKEMVEQYHQRGDGKVAVGGHAYKVTHPLTRMGWDARTGLAA